MGCSSSKTEEAASVQICRDRKNSIKQAIKHRDQLASSHVAYVQSLRRVSIALCTYVDENRYQYLLDSYMYHPYRYNKIFIEPNVTNSSVIVHYSRSQPNLPKTGTINPENTTIKFVDDLFTANVYPKLLTLVDKGESMDMEEEAENFLAKEGSEGDTNESTSAYRGLVEEEEGKVLQERRNRVVIGTGDFEEQTPGFTVHLSRIPASMLEVMKDVEAQFTAICDAASEVATFLEVDITNNHSNRDRRSQIIEASNTALRDSSNSNSDMADEPFELFKSQKASLQRLYEWEKKLYEEVKTGERIRIAYEKKFAQLKNQDLTGAEPSYVERTRATIRDLRTRLDLSFTSIESVSKRIENLRDEELYPRITELVQGLARLWQAMANAHRIQKHTLSQAKLLLQLLTSTTSPPPPVTAAINLASELRQWRHALSDWTTTQCAYATALSSWANSCVSDPYRGGPLPESCSSWRKAVEAVDEKKAGEGMSRLEERIKTVAARGRRRPRGGEEGEEEDWRRMICEGMAEVVALVEDVAAEATVAYEGLVRNWGNERNRGQGE